MAPGDLIGNLIVWNIPTFENAKPMYPELLFNKLSKRNPALITATQLRFNLIESTSGLGPETDHKAGVAGHNWFSMT